MRILVLSDSHGNPYNIRKALDAHPEVDRVIFLGDGERDIDAVSDEIGQRPLTAVRGNCDSSFSMLNETELVRAGEYLIYCTHGYREGVKYGIDNLLEKAKETGAEIVLYGHTHYQETGFENGMYIMNPGSIDEYEYGIIDIDKSGIMLLECSLR